MKKKVIKFIYIFIVITILIANYSFSFADASEIYNPIKEGTNPLYGAAGIIIGVIQWGGVAILIGMIMIKGIKYITAAPEGKAKIKEDIIMLAVGAILLFSFLEFIDIIYKFVQNSGINEIDV